MKIYEEKDKVTIKDSIKFFNVDLDICFCFEQERNHYSNKITSRTLRIFLKKDGGEYETELAKISKGYDIPVPEDFCNMMDSIEENYGKSICSEVKRYVKEQNDKLNTIFTIPYGV